MAGRLRWPLILGMFWHVMRILPALNSVPCDDRSGSLERRVAGADVVLAAYTRATHPRRPDGTYSAEFLVLNVLKGDEILSVVLRQRPATALESALSRRLLNVSYFGEKTRCHSDVSPGETYFLFLRANYGQINPADTGSFTDLMLYSREKEELIMDVLGLRSWGDWSPCSDLCGGGIQQRQRLCNGTQRCDNDEGQQRTCNTFSCSGSLDVLGAVGLRRSRLRPTDRPTAFRLITTSSWKTPSHGLLPSSFPLEFSLLLTFRISPPNVGGFLFGLYQSGNLHMGLFVGNAMSLVLSSEDNMRVTFLSSVADGRWHQAAFSMKKSTVTYFLDCKQKGKLPISRKSNASVMGQSLLLVIGEPGMSGKGNSNVFQGDIEQLFISENPKAAVQQCNTVTKPLVSRTSGLPLREEFRGRTSFPATQSDQLPLRGDIIDDEDFDFDENGSGLRIGDYENYDSLAEDSATRKQFLEARGGVPLKSEDVDYSEDISDHVEEPSFIDDTEKEKEEEKDQIEGSGNERGKEIEWSEWSPCSATCNWGKRTRTSFCVDNGVDIEKCSRGGNYAKTETEACFVKVCARPTFFPAATKNHTAAAVSPPSSKVGCTKKCQNGGRCKLLSTCSCPTGYHGELCQYGCGKLCMKGGLCNSDTGCRCPPGYIPPNCIALCKPNCRNAGVCVAPNKCQCKTGYFGRYCEKASCYQGCKNGGRCVAPGKCACPSGYSGLDCGQPVCEPMCQNGGHCIKPYSCHCPPSTKGAFCEKFLCQPECRNGGHCVGPGQCSCLKGFSGKRCEKAYCSEGCKNGGKCGKTGKCICPPEYRGLRCEARNCNFIPLKEPYKRGYRKKAVTTEKVPCGPLGWKQCTKTKVHYKMVYKTFYRTTYLCDSNTLLTVPPTHR